ncbi:hypothetical protein BM525_21635 (plasmid) [Alteromonas mediterranea]|uniref:DNA 3'-5' helicase n=1 Tax=Alteromonas mediterranea TaxID=314275 RepID=A0AAC9NTZ2_9ALTE|nr:ATP-dependent helicase [Alteromonas mediterranea]APD92464.1 hypothetical protein BM524_21415 [Alteromonas mediterranea]APE00325.1 hypothetical protein BM525_21635 [Alteromonas mediterranea]
MFAIFLPIKAGALNTLNLKAFNPEQFEAVTLSHDSNKIRNILLVAGAGSGKTRVIVHRIAYLIKHFKVAPRNILALTFTKKAALEMKSRTMSLLGAKKPVKMTTFHSLSADLLRSFGSTPVEIIDDNDKNKILRVLIKEKDAGEVIKLKAFNRWLDYHRSKCIDPEERLQNESATVSAYRDLAKGYRLTKAKMGQGVFDFDDLLEKVVTLLESNPRLVKTIHNRWRYILVDEYQDTNRIQFKFLNLLTGDRTQLMQVGDEDQLIYSWRGAEIEHILATFEASKKDKLTKCIVLDKNYRCSSNILKLANAIISQNVERSGKSLKAQKTNEHPVVIKQYSDCSSEAADIASQVRRWHDKGIKYRDMAVLFRVNRLSKSLESALISEGVPYTLANGVALFDTKESQLLLALLRFTERPSETFFIRDIFSFIKYGLGPATIDREDVKRQENGKDWVSHLMADPALMKKDRIHELVTIYKGAKERLDKGDLLGAAQHWFYKWDLLQFFKDDSKENRTDTILQLFEILSSYEHDASLRNLKPTVLDFQETRLLNDALMSDESDDALNLMTIHKAKGLEFECGTIMGIQDGVFPTNPDEIAEDVEEDLRLANVAITRFKTELIITRASFRKGFQHCSSYSSIIDSHLDKLLKGGNALYIDANVIDYERELDLI